MEVTAPGFATVSREISVAQRRTTFRVRMDLGMACFGTPGPIHGQVLGIRAGETYWVKAVPVRGIGDEEVQVDGGGTFVIPGLPAGDYIVLVLLGDAVVAQSTVRTYPVDRPVPPVRIDLRGVTK